MRNDLLNVLTIPLLLNTKLLKRMWEVGVILSHDDCHGYYIMICKTKITLVMPRVLIEYNLNHIWYAFLNRFPRHGLSNFSALLKWK